jgi:tetratricopeptide (TPR) repeat protein
MINAKNRPHPKYLVCLFLVVITLVSYWQLPTHDFLNFDDDGYITRNINVHKGITRESIAWAFNITNVDYWHPLIWLSHMLDFQLFGLKSGMHHLVNLFLHLANTLLLFFVLKRMTGSLWKSAFVAAMFAVHPLNVESVAWASERKNVLSTFFWILTMLAYVRYTERPTFLRYLLTFSVYALGLMAKPMLVTLPFALLLLDYWPLCRFNFAQSKSINQDIHKSKNAGFQRLLVLRLILEKIPLLVLSSGCIYLSSLSVQRLGIVISTVSVPMKLRIGNALVSYVSYIQKMVWPHNLVVYYPYPQMLPLWQVAGAGFLLVCISLLVLRALKSKPYLALGWLWYMGTLVPVIGLVQAGLWPATADRFTYVPLIGLFIVIAWGAPEIITKLHYKRVVLIVSATIVLSAFMICTWYQVRHWQNSVALFTHNLNVNYDNIIAHYELGNALKQQGKFDKALFHYSKALQINPNFAEVHNNLGHTLACQKDYKNAIYHYNEALRIKPKYTEAHNNLGTALAYQGNFKDAVYHFNKALEINPNYAGAYYNLGKLSANQGKIEKAILFYQKALELNPGMTQALYNLSWIIATHENEKYRNGEKAVKLAERLCKITQYNQLIALDALAAAYAETGRFDAAVLTVQKALKLALLSGPQELAMGLKERLKLYQAERPYRQSFRGKNES